MNKQMWNQAKHWRWSHPHKHTAHTDTHSHMHSGPYGHTHTHWHMRPKWTVEKLLQLQLCARCVHFLLETNIGWRYWKMVNIFVPGRQLLLSLLASLRKKVREFRGHWVFRGYRRFQWAVEIYLSSECSMRRGKSQTGRRCLVSYLNSFASCPKRGPKAAI